MAAKKTTAKRDVNQNVKRIFDEMVERSEEPPRRGELRPVENPRKK